MGSVPLLIAAIALAVSIPRAALLPTWPVLVGALGWIAAAAGKKSAPWLVDIACVAVAVSLVVFLLPALPGTFMSDGTKSVAILAGAWALLLGCVLPAIDGLLVRR
jgi:hypothetical protein